MAGNLSPHAHFHPAVREIVELNFPAYIGDPGIAVAVKGLSPIAKIVGKLAGIIRVDQDSL
ncbi:hypothetical protein FQZ97_1228720 [compost metagenome]